MRIMLSAMAAALVGFAPSAVFAEEEGEAAGPDPRLGQEVNRICFPRNIRDWRTVKGEDNVVLLERGLNDWYRVEVVGPCNYRALRFTQTIALESRPSGACVSAGDTITLLDSTGFERRCAITQINIWDEDAKAPEETSEEPETGDRTES